MRRTAHTHTHSQTNLRHPTHLTPTLLPHLYNRKFRQDSPEQGIRVRRPPLQQCDLPDDTSGFRYVRLVVCVCVCVCVCDVCVCVCVCV